jgi:hypothetical protein
LKKQNSLLQKTNNLGFVWASPACKAIVTSFFLCASAPAFSQSEEPQHYVCYRPGKTPKIDGKLDESAWKKAEWTNFFVDIEGPLKPLPLQKTRAKMLWDDQYLYIAAVLEEEHIWAYQDKKDQIVFHENDFEVFIDPDNDTKHYFELEINAINNNFDLFLTRPYRHGGRAQLDWNIDGLKSAVHIDGTVNNPSDKDKSWTLEMAIPFAALNNGEVKALMPVNDAVWRINFSRVNWQHDVVDGKYVRRRTPDGRRHLPEYNWVWSPQGKINMHIPEKWGYLQFSSLKAGKRKVSFKKPTEPALQ